MILSPFNAKTWIFAGDAGVVVCEPPRRKAAIIGCGPSRFDAPWDDPSWECWGLNRVLTMHDSEGRFRADRWFELHVLEAQSEADMRWIRECPVPLYMIERFPGIPNAVRFPIERAIAAGRDWFTCTFAMQIAFALAEGFEEIGLFGVDLDLGTPRERIFERMCVAWWLGLAAGRGVKVTLPERCTILTHPHRYGYDYYAEKEAVEIILENLAVRMAPWDAEYERERAVLKDLKGGIGG